MKKTRTAKRKTTTKTTLRVTCRDGRVGEISGRIGERSICPEFALEVSNAISRFFDGADLFETALRLKTAAKKQQP